jgi:molybdenum cofactor cytidylyltransferase
VKPNEGQSIRPERVGSVAGVLLAAGSSTRMGRNKLLLPLDGESVLRRAVMRALASGLDPVLVVLGHESERVSRELSGLPCRPVQNPGHAGGIQTSLKAGIAAIPAEARAAVVLLADMPLVTREMLAAVVERYRESQASLVLSEYGGVQAPPTLYDRSLFAELLAEEGEGCSKRVIRRHSADAETLSWPAATLADLDSPEDYDRVRGHSRGETPCAPIC